MKTRTCWGTTIAEAILRGDLAPGDNTVAVRDKKTDTIEFRYPGYRLRSRCL